PGGKVEIHCIEEYRRYCDGKPSGLVFSDGCRLCKCKNRTVFCKKGGCSFFAEHDQDVLDYCDSVLEKNAQTYKKAMAKTKKNVTDLEPSTKSTLTSKLNLDNTEEVAGSERVEAKANIRKLLNSYISNHLNEFTPSMIDELFHLAELEGSPAQENAKQEIEKSNPISSQQVQSTTDVNIG
uniref:Nuclear receptor domain-containing protein n=1 Tax=Mesocestoides corti TaxID=53468 RepID=A0A5K3FSR8_MESCO